MAPQAAWVAIPAQAAARYCLEICYLQGIVCAALPAGLQDGPGQRVLALFLQCIGQLQKLCLLDALRRENVRSLRFAAGDGSGLI